MIDDLWAACTNRQPPTFSDRLQAALLEKRRPQEAGVAPAPVRPHPRNLCLPADAPDRA